MEKLAIKISTLALALVIVGCGRSLRDRDFEERAVWFDSYNPVEDARIAVSNGEFYFMEVKGISRTVPGLSSSEITEIEDRFKFQVIPDISDSLESKSHRRYVTAALRFAEAYNAELFRLVGPS